MSSWSTTSKLEYKLSTLKPNLLKKNITLNNFLFKKKTHNLTLPKWAEPILQKIMDNVRWGFYFDYRLPEMAKLQTG